MNIVCESEKSDVEELINAIREKLPSFASIGDISVEYADYTGEYVSFERTNGGVPKEATLGDLLGVMQSFDTKAETLVMILNDMNGTLKSVKEDTSQIKGIKEGTEVMKDKLTSIEEMHEELRDLRVKYNQLSDDVTEIKIAISELSESRVGVPA